MAIVFPASPSVNDTFTAGSITYKWDGDKWIGLGVTPADRLVEGSNSLEITAGNDLVWTGDAVGLKNSSPVMALDIGDGTQQNTLRVNSSTVSLVSLTSGNTSQSRIEFGDLDNNDTGYIYYDNSTDSMQFATNGSNERLRITSGGTLLSYSPDDTTPNFKWRSDDTNWHGALNVSVEGGSIASFWSTGGDWSVDGTTYSCTKNLAAYPSAAIALHNQYNSSFESKLVFLNKAGGSTTTDGGVAELASISSAGIISDSMGPLRRLGSNTQAGAYTLVAGDAGKYVAQSSNSASVTVPNAVFSAGDMVTIVNLTATNINIVQGTGLDLNFTADGTTGTRTLAAKGVCTILFVSSGTSFISGSGLS